MKRNFIEMQLEERSSKNLKEIIEKKMNKNFYYEYRRNQLKKNHKNNYNKR
jgi:hypothetical protein